MSHKLRIQTSVTTYLQATQSGALRRAVQASHAGMDNAALTERLSTVFPNLTPDTIDELVLQANQAIEGADDCNQSMMTVPVLEPSTWGYDPSLSTEWMVLLLFYAPAPTSWWTRLIEYSGEQLPLPDDMVRSIAAIERMGGQPSMGRPYPENAVYVGLRDQLPELTKATNIRLTALLRSAEKGQAPAWFQAAFNTANELGVYLGDWGSNFAAIVSGVFRSTRK